MIGENIKRYRTLKGLSLRKFGELVGLSQTAIAKYENNKAKPEGGGYNETTGAVQ